MKHILINFNLSNSSLICGLDFLTNILTKKHIPWAFIPAHNIDLSPSSNFSLATDHIPTFPKNCILITDQTDPTYLASLKKSGIQKLILLTSSHTLQKTHSAPVDQVITNFYDFYQRNIYSLLL